MVTVCEVCRFESDVAMKASGSGLLRDRLGNLEPGILSTRRVGGMSLPSNTVVEQVMNSSSFQIEQCPVCLHVSLLHGCAAGGSATPGITVTTGPRNPLRGTKAWDKLPRRMMVHVYKDHASRPVT